MNMENLNKVIRENKGNGNYFVFEIFNLSPEIVGNEENDDENVLCIYDKDENGIDYINVGKHHYGYIIDLLRNNNAEFYVNIME